MANYLLLRDNREKGPYSLNELLELGLKPYDLVWIEGKSAAWRYPSEVEELKAYTSVSEEQPFDRFFKKNTEVLTSISDSHEKNELPATQKKIFVTLPPSQIEIAETKPELSPSSENAYRRVQTITVSENPVAAEIKFAQPLDEIKEMYAKTYQHRKDKIARKNLVLKTLKRASALAFILAMGIMIGFFIKSKSPKNNIADQSLLPPIQNSTSIQTTAAATNTQMMPEQGNAIIPENLIEPTKESDSRSNSNNEKSITQKSKPAILNENSINNNVKKSAPDLQNAPAAVVNDQNGERNKKSRTGDNENTISSQEDISSLVSVKGSDYKHGAFGGIRDLQLTVRNDSKYILNNVLVELQYLKPSEQPLKTENISFQNIAPNGSLTIAIPPSKRGIKVEYKIIKIQPKQLSNETTGL